MKSLHLIGRELRFHKWNTVLSVISAASAVSCVLGALMLLRTFDARTEQLVAAKEAEVQAQMDRMQDEYRKLTKKMGFNVIILPKDQNMTDFHSENYADKTMPEEFARRLASARDIMTVRHILPMLQQKIEWPEQKRKVLLIGVPGAVALPAYGGTGDPLVKSVPADSVALGSELHRSLGLKVDDSVSIMGRSFRVSALQPERGTIDDITVWMDLAEAQDMLGRKGLINCIVALECECAWGDLPKVRAEIQRVLPETQVIELAGKALARAEARNEAARNATAVIEREKTSRSRLRADRESLLAVLVPLVVAGCAIWIALLAWMNARERRSEIGILRAIGYNSAAILAIFLGRAALLGLAGSTSAIALAWFAGRIVPAAGGMTPGPAALALLASPAVAVLACWIPALMAASEDPAESLRDE
jgi:ABC-type lipoprotein release transport system permease subunit